MESNIGDWRLPADHKPCTDKYFIHTGDVLAAEDINTRVGVKVFARGDGPIPEDGLDEAVDILDRYAPDLTEHGTVWVTEKDTFETKDPLMLIEGPIQDIVELETLYLGSGSHNLTAAHPDYELPTYDTFYENVKRATEIYAEADRADGSQGIPLLYFGARHYHPALDKALAKAALDGGAIQTSTDVGSSNIGEEGVGTMPHVKMLTFAHEHGWGDYMAEAVDAFDDTIKPDQPFTSLIDTRNREQDDALAVCELLDAKYGEGNWTHQFRVDTCGENVMQGVDRYDGDRFADLDFNGYEHGTGVRVAGVVALRDRLIDEGYGDQTDLILSSGFGNPEKADAFVKVQDRYVEDTGHDLFTGVGAGAFVDGVHLTADMYMADGEPMAKVGREQDLDAIETYKQHMEQVI